MLRILTKHLINERAWLRTESLGATDAKFREGARMAKERVPQLETAIEILSKSINADVSAKGKGSNHVAKPKDISHRKQHPQLNLF